MSTTAPSISDILKKSNSIKSNQAAAPVQIRDTQSICEVALSTSALMLSARSHSDNTEKNNQCLVQANYYENVGSGVQQSFDANAERKIQNSFTIQSIFSKAGVPETAYPMAIICLAKFYGREDISKLSFEGQLAHMDQFFIYESGQLEEGNPSASSQWKTQDEFESSIVAAITEVKSFVEVVLPYL